MKLYQVEYLLEVCAQGSFSKAADALLVSRPAISRAMKDLEDEYGVTLFQRTTTGVVPTEAGEIILEKSQKIMQLLSELESEINALKSSESDESDHLLRIGISFTARCCFLPFVSAFWRVFPNVQINLTDLSESFMYRGGVDPAFDLEIALSDDTAAALVTTVYYRAAWTQQFHMTVPGVFHGLGGDRELNFLTQTLINKTLYKGDGFLPTGLSLSGGQGTAWFLLPDENLTPADLLSNQRTLDFLISDKGRGNTDGCQVDLTISVPKFDVSDKTDLIEKLKKLGVISIFDRCRSDFTPLTTDLQEPITVSKAEHGARVSADENGLTGAAYTIIEPTYSGIPEPLEKFELTLDRPFLFVVANEEGLPIFVGIVNQP